MVGLIPILLFIALILVIVFIAIKRLDYVVGSILLLLIVVLLLGTTKVLG